MRLEHSSAIFLLTAARGLFWPPVSAGKVDSEAGHAAASVSASSLLRTVPGSWPSAGAEWMTGRTPAGDTEPFVDVGGLFPPRG